MSQKDDAIIFDDDEILFADETSDEISLESGRPWKLMVVDDEADIHDITRLALEDFTFEGEGLLHLNAYSGAEARQMIRENPDVAVILLDVVMETENSGLEVVEYIRNQLENRFVRIILRTGHPGQAPERKVITEYDINDYKQKTELTAKKLFTSVTTAIRSCRDLRLLEKNRQGLGRIIDASANFFKLRTLKNFTEEALILLISLLRPDENLSPEDRGFSSFAATRRRGGEFIILAASGRFRDHICQAVTEAIPEKAEVFIQAVREQQSVFTDHDFMGYISSQIGPENVILVESPHPLSELDRDLVRIFLNNAAIAIDNIYLNQEITDTQKEIITTLGEVVENRSKETANHALRVAEMSKLLALRAGLSKEDAEVLRMVVPMHDVGKIGIPDAILLKPGRLTFDEFEVIKTHTQIGYNILKNSGRQLMKTAALIALQHHERCDGKGYPNGLKGDEIHIFGRIVEIIDVFDALSHDRIYKEAWELERILALFREERGKHFDPCLMDLFMDNLDEFVAINRQYPDDDLV